MLIVVNKHKTINKKKARRKIVTLEDFEGFLPSNIIKPEIFKLIYEQNVDIKEMYRVFNMGVGFVVICDESEADKIMETLNEYC